MTEFLLFTVHAPLASWGEIAVGEMRNSWRFPARSAVLGLIGASLGVNRLDAEGQAALVQDYRMAVRNAVNGTGMVDYHTVRTVSASQVKRHKPSTRAELMAIEPFETLLSQREYRQNAVYTVALWAAGTPRWSLGNLAKALRHPKYVPYAGRRSNPLALPFHPTVVAAETLAEALTNYPPIPDALLNSSFRSMRARGRQWGREVAHDTTEGFPSGLESGRREVRRDVPVDRGIAWLFAQRVVEYGLLPAAGEE